MKLPKLPPLPRVDPSSLRAHFVLTMVAGTFVCLLLALVLHAPARRLFEDYVAGLDRRLRGLFLPAHGRRIALAQAAIGAAALGLHASSLLPDFTVWSTLSVAGITVAVPQLWLLRARRERVRAIETQLDTFVVSLSSALKATPSIGDAIVQVHALSRGPLAEELAVTIRDMRLGSTLEQALTSMKNRAGSAQLDMALLPVLVGRQVGGDLPRILEVTAGTIREMSRVAAVVRTKTSEGRIQLWVLALFPFGIVTGLTIVSPDYFDAMTRSAMGVALLGVAVALWGAAVFIGSRILAMEV